MKKYIACRVRNSMDIIEDFMSYYDCFDGFFFYDDQSNDGTREYLEAQHNSVVVNEKEDWKSSSWKEQVDHRTQACKKLLDVASPDDWLFLLDSDEFISFDFNALKKNSVITLDLFDAVITEEDKNGHFLSRKWFEKRSRRIAFAVKCGDFEKVTGHRTLIIKSGRALSEACGVVRHFGRARSLNKFDEKCDYYTDHAIDSYKKKWSARKGNGVVKIDSKKHFDWNEVYGSYANNVEIKKNKKSS
jgi:hypothetical protein